MTERTKFSHMVERTYEHHKKKKKKLMASPVGGTPLASRKRKQLKRDFDKDTNLLKKYGPDADRARTYLSDSGKARKKKYGVFDNILNKFVK
tara:strand:- start:217 stop:492 length:276 start_codon:yes stop_codon:yes gene_type:complete